MALSWPQQPPEKPQHTLHNTGLKHSPAAGRGTATPSGQGTREGAHTALLTRKGLKNPDAPSKRVSVQIKERRSPTKLSVPDPRHLRGGSQKRCCLKGGSNATRPRGSGASQDPADTCASRAAACTLGATPGGVELGRGQTGLPLSLDILIFYFLKNEDFLEDPHVKCKATFVDLLGPASRAVPASPASWHTSPWT